MSVTPTVGKPAVEICEEAVFTLRHAPAAAWATYYIGSMPFILGFLYFWSNMTRGRHSQESLIYGSLFLALLFIWMKAWQVVFAMRIRALITGNDWTGLTAREFWRIAVAQAKWQPWGLLVMPLALVLTVPFGWVYAYYQNLVALCTPHQEDLAKLHGKAISQSRLWPAQNHLLLAIFSGLSFVVLLNLGVMLMALPQILITFFGIKEMFHPNLWLLVNTTFFMVLICLMHLILDPFAKVLYVLRTFYGESRVTGEDLRVQLQRSASLRKSLPQAIAALLAVTFLQLNAQGATVQPTPEKLNEHISEVLKKPEYDWRLPREVIEREDKSWVASFFEAVARAIWRFLKMIGELILNILEWIANIFKRKAGAAGSSSWSLGDPKGLLTVLAAAVVLIAIYFLWKNRVRSRKPTIFVAQATPTIPDISDENVTAEQLPEDEWLKMAHDLVAQGDLRLAIRALFLGALAHLATRQFVSLAKFKSNRDYERELKRRTAGLPQVSGAFSSMVGVYDRIWYGLYDPSPEMYDECQQRLQLLKTC